jgi:hypothetical protein
MAGHLTDLGENVALLFPLEDEDEDDGSPPAWVLLPTLVVLPWMAMLAFWAALLTKWERNK